MEYVANPVSVTAYKITEVRNPEFGVIPLVLENGQVANATQEMISRMVPAVGDYWVIQSDGYVYLNPKEVFERKYSEFLSPAINQDILRAERRGIADGLSMALDSMNAYYDKYSCEFSREDTGGALITIVEELIKHYEGE